MNGKKLGSVVLIVFFFMTGFLAVNNAIAGPGGHGGFGDPVFGLLHRLDLNDAQKTIVAGVLKNYVGQLQSAVTQLATDRATLSKDILSQAAGNQITNDASQVAKDQGVLIQLRSTIMSAIIVQLTPTLSTDQQTILQTIQSKLGKNITARMDMRFAHLNQWIANHSQ
jgi:hypothetical protein